MKCLFVNELSGKVTIEISILKVQSSVEIETLLQAHGSQLVQDICHAIHWPTRPISRQRLTALLFRTSINYTYPTQMRLTSTHTYTYTACSKDLCVRVCISWQGENIMDWLKIRYKDSGQSCTAQPQVIVQADLISIYYIRSYDKCIIRFCQKPVIMKICLNLIMQELETLTIMHYTV